MEVFVGLQHDCITISIERIVNSVWHQMPIAPGLALPDPAVDSKSTARIVEFAHYILNSGR